MPCRLCDHCQQKWTTAQLRAADLFHADRRLRNMVTVGAQLRRAHVEGC